MLKDKDIRERLIYILQNENKNHKPFKIIEELSVCNGDARVDVAVANGRLCGYEIKSDKDTLDRLQNQIECYNTTFDTMTIIVGERYIELIKEYIPEWWGIRVAYLNKFNNVTIKKIRKTKKNPHLDSSFILQLLWKDELIEFLAQNGIKKISSKNKSTLRDIALEKIPLNVIKYFTREKLKTRVDWRDD